MISLNIDESETEVIFGIPQYIDVSSNSGVIYYTFDETIPTEDSLIAGDKIYLPTDMNSFEIKIVAISESDKSEVYSNRYTVKSAKIRNTRKGNEAGVVVMTESSEGVDFMGYDSDGSPARETSIQFSDLDIRASMVMTSKEYSVSEGETSVDFINFSKKDEYNSDFFKSSLVNNNNNFDPKSKVVIINGRDQSEQDSQSVLLINRAYGTFDPASKFYVENETTFEQIISGNLVRSVYNCNTGVITSYYYESRESRWIISNQKIEPKTLNISNGRPKNFVYKWIKDPVMSKIF